MIASNQRSRRWPITLRLMMPTASTTSRVAIMAMVFCTHSALIQPR